jgi:hypothetical protein
MLMSQLRVLRMFLKGMRGGNGQRADRDHASHEEENLVHGDSQADA